MRVVLIALGAAVSASAALAGPPAHGPWLLAAVPSVATVRWTCIDAAPSLRTRHRLTVTVERDGATTAVTLRIGRGVVSRRAGEPGQTIELPWTTAKEMTLTLRQATEPPSLVATVAVDFTPSRRITPACERYLPPAVTTTVRYR